MVCRHAPGDPAHGQAERESLAWSAQESERKLKETESELRRVKQAAEEAAASPDSTRFAIEDSLQVGKHLVIKATYPNCRKCSYEGVKVMVYLNVTERDALRWRKIDPHFTDESSQRQPHEAPGPAARFPGSPAGWLDAVEYAKRKT